MELSPRFVNVFSRALALTRLRLPHGSFLIDQPSPPSLSGAELRDSDNFCQAPRLRSDRDQNLPGVSTEPLCDQ
jgi:hypothetical protein